MPDMDMDLFKALKDALIDLSKEIRHYKYATLDKTDASSKLHDFSFIFEPTLPLLLQSTYLCTSFTY